MSSRNIGTPANNWWIRKSLGTALQTQVGQQQISTEHERTKQKEIQQPGRAK
jgi:hypothetical protein